LARVVVVVVALEVAVMAATVVMAAVVVHHSSCGSGGGIDEGKGSGQWAVTKTTTATAMAEGAFQQSAKRVSGRSSSNGD
jgi:hypothetical protein